MKNLFKKLMIIIILLVIIAVIIVCIYTQILYPRNYKDIVEQAASMYNVDPNLIYAVIKQESKFNETAISKSKAKGLMQILDSTSKDMAKNIDSIDENDINLFDPYTNILIGTKYLSYLISYYNGNYYLAIAAYNAGLGKVNSWIKEDIKKYTNHYNLLEIIEYDETKVYVINVIKNYEYYTKLYN